MFTEKEKVIAVIYDAARYMTENELTAADIHEKTSAADLVTVYDVKVQETLIAAFRSLFPNAEFFAEEKKDNRLTDALTFIIDPIDGTANFVAGLRHSAISVGILQEKKPLAGFIYDPYQDELFYAVRGEGAFLRHGGKEKPITVCRHPFPVSLVGFGTDPYHKENTPLLAALVKLCIHRFADMRRAGAATLDLAYVAAGRLDIFFETGLSPWDYAAGRILVEEAGGSCTRFSGEEVNYERCSILAGGAEIVKEFKENLLPEAEKQSGIKVTI